MVARRESPESEGAVGVFDSGVGGISVLREIRTLLPAEDLVFVADSGNVPYGSKSPAFIESRSTLITQFLLSEGSKAIVVACNTATAAAVSTLRRDFEVPIIGMEPAVKPAAALTKTGVVGVLATVGTTESARFAALLDRFARAITVVTEHAPGLVEEIEKGDLASAELRRLVEKYTAPLVAASADTIVLGSTHYHFVRPVAASVLGASVALIDTGAAVAQQLRRILSDHALLADPTRIGSERFFSTGDTVRSARAASALWGSTVAVRALPEPFAGRDQ